MGCNHSKKPVAQAAVQTPALAPTIAAVASPPSEKKAEHSPKPEKPQQPIGGVEILGTTGSMNCMAPVMLVAVVNCGQLVPTKPGTDTHKPGFLAINPFHAVPTMKDEGHHLAETSTILRYLAEKYALDLYPPSLHRRAFIDWAIDRFATGMQSDVHNTIYAALGYAGMPEKPLQAGDDCTHNLLEFAAFFLKERFIGGDKLSIADYRVAPFFFCFAHPMLKEKHFVEIPGRILQFNQDFAAACHASAMMSSAGGHSLKELLDAKYGSSPNMLTVTSVHAAHVGDLFSHQHPAGKGKVELYGLAGSMNCAGPLMLLRHMDIGKMVHIMPGEATKTKEYLAMNPFHAVPTMKDGGVCVAESNAILRYLAANYAQDYYPTDKRSFIDWALDRFTTGMSSDVTHTLYPCLGYAPLHEDPEVRRAHGHRACEHLQSFADFFLRGKFVGGRGPCIADFKIAPFFFSYGHPLVREKFCMDVPARILKFNEDFAKAIKASSILCDAEGFSLKEMLDKMKAPAGQ